MIGQTIAHYTIREKIGAGGMGEVYRATDAKLNRDVALKILPEVYTRDAQRMGRFQREAQLLASLNHANIAAIYGLEEDGATRALVLELVEGEDLAETLESRKLTTDEAIEFAGQIAEALEFAHENNVIHRDLKPANVKVTPEGKVKVLDFGLAKALAGDPDADGAELSQSMSPTMTVGATGAGLILGTAAYMSPEQARGKQVDRRADIWAFGVVLYEMLTRKQLFAGETVSDTLAAVIKDEPDWDLIPADTPALVGELVRRCLEKDPRRRLQSIGEARIALEDLLRGGTSSAPTMSMLASSMGHAAVAADPEPAKKSGPGRIVWITALVLVAVASAFVGSQFGDAAPEARARKFHVDPDGLLVGYPTHPSLSPDGRRIAYFGMGATLYIRDLESLESVEIPNSSMATSPFWSPDGAWLAFGMSSRLYKVPAVGGSPMAICDLPFAVLDGGSWGDDDQIILAPNSGPLYVVPSRGGDPRVLFPSAPGESDFHTPSALPDGRGVLFTTHNEKGRQTIEVLSDGERKIILEIDGARLEYASWSPEPGSTKDGYLIYHRMVSNNGVWAVPFNLESLETTGAPFILDPDGAYPSVGRDGSLVYSLGSSGGLQQLVKVNRAGEMVEELGQPQVGMIWPRLSPSGRYALVSANEGETRDIWLHDLVRGTSTRKTFGDGPNWNSVWLDSDDEFVFSRGSAQTNESLRQPLDGSLEPVKIVDGYHPTIRSTSEYMAFVRFQAGTGDDILFKRVDGEGEETPFLVTKATETGAQLSPDGRFLLYMSNESGGNEVYLAAFPSGAGRWQVSTNGGVWPKWSRAGDEIIYRTGAGGIASLMSVTFESDPTVRLGTPVRLFGAAEAPRAAFGLGHASYEPMPDPEFLLIVKSSGEALERTVRLVYVENWRRSAEALID